MQQDLVKKGLPVRIVSGRLRGTRGIVVNEPIPEFPGYVEVVLTGYGVTVFARCRDLSPYTPAIERHPTVGRLLGKLQLAAQKQSRRFGRPVPLAQALSAAVSLYIREYDLAAWEEE